MMFFKKKKKKEKREFSKTLLVQESALIWVITIAFVALAFYCVIKQYFGELPWITALAGFPWTAYGVSQAFYYRKAMAENTKDGIKYETVMNDLECQNSCQIPVDPCDNFSVDNIMYETKG